MNRKIIDKYERKIENISNFDLSLKFIENNLDKEESFIKDTIKDQFGVCERTLNKWFADKAELKTGYKNVKINEYIKDRRREKSCQAPLKTKKFDVSDDLENAKIELIKYSYNILDISIEQLKNDKKRCLNLLINIFKEQPYLYYNLRDDFEYDIEEIIEFRNNALGLKSNSSIIDKCKLELYNDQLLINGINYYISNSGLIKNILKALDWENKLEWPQKVFSLIKNNKKNYKFRTIFYDMQKYTSLLKDIRRNNYSCKDKEAINSYRCQIDITDEESIKNHYNQSIEELYDSFKVTFPDNYARMVFNAILNMENEKKSITINDLLKYSGISMLGLECGLTDLLLEGYIYIYE